MSTNGTLIVGLVVLGLLWLAVVYLLGEFADWAYGRQAARDAAASFECDFIPHPADVAPADRRTDAILSSVREAAAVDAAERVIYEAEMVDLLDEVMPDARAIGERRAAR